MLLVLLLVCVCECVIFEMLFNVPEQKALIPLYGCCYATLTLSLYLCQHKSTMFYCKKKKERKQQKYPSTKNGNGKKHTPLNSDEKLYVTIFSVCVCVVYMFSIYYYINTMSFKRGTHTHIT